MSKTKGQNYMHGAAILTVGVVIMKLLGFIYKIPLGNILGDEGYSMFLSAYNIYFIFFTLATAGLPVALSRLVAEADANGRAKQEEKLFRVAWMMFFVRARFSHLSCSCIRSGWRINTWKTPTRR